MWQPFTINDMRGYLSLYHLMWHTHIQYTHLRNILQWERRDMQYFQFQLPEPSLTCLSTNKDSRVYCTFNKQSCPISSNIYCVCSRCLKEVWHFMSLSLKSTEIPDIKFKRHSFKFRTEDFCHFVRPSTLYSFPINNLLSTKTWVALKTPIHIVVTEMEWNMKNTCC